MTKRAFQSPCDDPNCWICSAIDIAFRRRVTPGPKRPRDRTKYPPPFAPYYRGVYWAPFLNQWYAQYRRRVLGYFPPTEDGHYMAGRAYALASGRPEPVPKQTKEEK